MGVINIKSKGSLVPYANRVFNGTNSIPADIMDKSKGILSFDFIPHENVSSIHGYKIFSENPVVETILSAGKTVTLTTDPFKTPPVFKVKNSDDYENYRKSKLMSNYNYNQISIDILNRANYPHPYITQLSPDQCYAIGLGKAIGTMIYFPIWSGENGGWWGTQLFLRIGFGTPARNDAGNEPIYPNYKLAYRTGENDKWQRWDFDTFNIELHRAYLTYGYDPNNDTLNNVNVHNTPTLVHSTINGRSIKDIPDGFIDGALTPIVHHNGKPNFTSESPDANASSKYMYQTLGSWWNDTMWFRSYRAGAAYGMSQGWSQWKEFLFDRGKSMVDRRSPGKPIVSMAIGNTNTGLNYDSDGVISWHSNGVKQFTVKSDGLHMSLSNNMIHVRHIEGLGTPYDGIILLNYHNGKDVYFKDRGGVDRTLQDLFIYANEGKTKVVDVLIEKGIAASTTESWDSLKAKLRQLRR